MPFIHEAHVVISVDLMHSIRHTVVYVWKQIRSSDPVASKYSILQEVRSFNRRNCLVIWAPQCIFEMRLGLGWWRHFLSLLVYILHWVSVCVRNNLWVLMLYFFLGYACMGSEELLLLRCTRYSSDLLRDLRHFLLHFSAPDPFLIALEHEVSVFAALWPASYVPSISLDNLGEVFQIRPAIPKWAEKTYFTDVWAECQIGCFLKNISLGPVRRANLLFRNGAVRFKLLLKHVKRVGLIEHTLEIIKLVP